MNYREALAWLYATQRFGIKLGLENIERLLFDLKIDVASPPPGSARGPRANARPARTFGSPPKTSVIHVAGTNGKGSVCAMIDSIARAAGYRSGLFTSPHLVSFRERIRVNGEMISENDVASGLSEIRALVRDWDPHPTFFELVTALALQHFQKAECEIIVLETGMGGRLDATNAISANVSVITPIDFDHEKWLGHTIAEIAQEKAGIVKPHVPVISAPQRAEARAVIEKRAQQCDAPLRFVRSRKRKVSLRGKHQTMNADLAIAALRALDSSISEKAISTGLESVDWPARFQIYDDWIVIDGAHNPAGAKILAQTWREEFDGELPTIVLAVLRDKNAAAIVAALAPIAKRFIFPQIRSERALPSDDLARISHSITPLLHYSLCSSASDSLIAAKRFPERILITGSLHFAGEVLAILRDDADSLEDCAQ